MCVRPSGRQRVGRRCSGVRPGRSAWPGQPTWYMQCTFGDSPVPHVSRPAVEYVPPLLRLSGGAQGETILWGGLGGRAMESRPPFPQPSVPNGGGCDRVVAAGPPVLWTHRNAAGARRPLWPPKVCHRRLGREQLSRESRCGRAGPAPRYPTPPGRKNAPDLAEDPAGENTDLARGFDFVLQGRKLLKFDTLLQKRVFNQKNIALIPVNRVQRL
eukprot:gene9890-biopygen13803